jgi:mycofactocin precursor
MDDDLLHGADARPAPTGLGDPHATRTDGVDEVPVDEVPVDEVQVDDLLEDVSIDGMCGVY